MKETMKRYKLARQSFKISEGRHIPIRSKLLKFIMMTLLSLLYYIVGSSFREITHKKNDEKQKSVFPEFIPGPVHRSDLSSKVKDDLSLGTTRKNSAMTVRTINDSRANYDEVLQSQVGCMHTLQWESVSIGGIRFSEGRRFRFKFIVSHVMGVLRYFGKAVLGTARMHYGNDFSRI